MPDPNAEANAPASAALEHYDLIPRTLVFGNPTRAQARISPDGTRLSFLAPHEGVMNIWVAPADALDDAQALTQDRGRGIRFHMWSYDNRYLLYLQDAGGDENHHVFAVDADSGEVRDLTPVPPGTRAMLEALSPQEPGVAIVSTNERDKALPDLYSVDVATGQRTLLLQNPGYSDIVMDNALTPRIAYRPTENGDLQVHQSTDGQKWAATFTVPAADIITSYVVAFNRDNSKYYRVDSIDKDTSALYEVDFATGATTLIGQDPRADIARVLVHPVSRSVLGYATNYLKTQWQPATDASARLLAAAARLMPGELQFTSWTADGRYVLADADSPDQPGTYYLLDTEKLAAEKLFSARPNLAGMPLQPMQTAQIPTGDGLTLTAYITLPPGSDTDGDGTPETPVPMVLDVHGGPWGRDDYGYDATHQWLANRGYAVMSVNYRGSTGFGKTFVNAAVREFAGKMHTDLIDAVDWAIRAGVTAPDTVAIMGGSYGGYATLVGLTFTPDRFACGVDIVGPSNLASLIESFPPYWGPMLASTWFKFVGDPSDADERSDMLARSPLTRVDAIRSPLLIGQGANDPRVTKHESDQIVDAMAKRDLPVTYLNYPDEGHGFQRPENRMSFYAVTEAFLSQCLGGRFEPIGGAFDGSSVEILHGAGFVPGLVEQTGTE